MNTSHRLRLVLMLGTVLALCSVSWSSEIHEAAEGGDTNAVEALLEANPDFLEARDVLGRTPLHVAAWWGRTKITELLLTKRAKVNARDDSGAISLQGRQTRRSSRSCWQQAQIRS